MNQIQALKELVVSNHRLHSALKAVGTDAEFVEIFVSTGRENGFSINPEAVWAQMESDRQTAAQMPIEEFEEVAGSMLGARLSGGHHSGSNC